ncbi:MAG: hypothetical protein VX738_06710 [Planctomycetota bacterium]|nr:hypothetical protein [Planctomycetota bacterium]
MAELFAKPSVWGSVLLAIVCVSGVWAWIESSANAVRTSEGWDLFHRELIAEFSNISTTSAVDVQGVISQHESKFRDAGVTPWAYLFKANVLLQQAVAPDTTAQPNPLNPSAGQPSLLSGDLELRRNNLKDAYQAFQDVLLAASQGEETSLNKIAEFRGNYGAAYCAEALMIVGDPSEFDSNRLNAVTHWEAASGNLNGDVVDAMISNRVADHLSAVSEMSSQPWKEGDPLTEQKFLSWVAKNDPRIPVPPESDPLNPLNELTPSPTSNLPSDPGRDSVLPVVPGGGDSDAPDPDSPDDEQSPPDQLQDE